MLTVGSLFAGIGGLDLGLERAGMQVRWQIENNPYCIRVLETHWPKVKRYGNIFEVDGATLEPVDLICGGFPCQPVSKAGKRKGKAVIESRKGKTIVGLLKGDTSTKCFHEYILPYAEIRFIRGRLRFSGADRAPFPSIIAIWRGKA